LHEYPSDYLEKQIQALSFDIIANNVSSSSTFTPVPDDSLPDWVNDNTINFLEGWWFFEDSRYDTIPAYTYVLYDSDQTVLRAGNDLYEYYPDYVENNVDDFSFDRYALLALNNSSLSFTLVPDYAPPEWSYEEDGTLQFEEGWWEYQIYNSDFSTELYYILYDSNQSVLRAGSWSQELENTDNSFYSWDHIAQSECTQHIFILAPEEFLPGWIVDEHNNNGTSGIWWVFEDGWNVNGMYYDLYAYYEASTFIKGGIQDYQIPNDNLLISVMSFEDATSSWIGVDYQLTDLSQLPSWAY
jgi:hypothetical protein